jgi:hypothetical protein
MVARFFYGKCRRCSTMAKLDRFVMLRISTSDAEAISELKDRWGVSRGDVLRMLLRDAARRSETGARPPVLAETPAPAKGQMEVCENGKQDLGN